MSESLADGLSGHGPISTGRRGRRTGSRRSCRRGTFPPAEVVITGTKPFRRSPGAVRACGSKPSEGWGLDPGNPTPAELTAVNTALRDWLGGDDVQNADRVMRLAGTVSYPSPAKVERGYVPELTKLYVTANAQAYRPADLISSLTNKPDPYLEHNKQAGTGSSGSNRSKSNGTGGSTNNGASGGAGAGTGSGGTGPRKRGRTDAEIAALLESSRRSGNWHIPILKAIASMIGRGWANKHDPDDVQAVLQGRLRRPRPRCPDRPRAGKWGEPPEEAVEPGATSARTTSRA